MQRAGARQQIETLEHEPNLAIADGGAIVVAQAGDFLPVEVIIAGGGTIEASEDVHQRALARARSAP